jgi:hypothetical protein
MLTAEWLKLVLYFSTEYSNSRQSIIVLFWKYLVDIRSKTWLNLFWVYINGKLFSVRNVLFSAKLVERSAVDVRTMGNIKGTVQRDGSGRK